MKTESEIMSAPADEVVGILAEFNAWRRRCSDHWSMPCTAIELGWYIDRAVQLLNRKGEQKWSVSNSTFPNGNGLTGEQK